MAIGAFNIRVNFDSQNLVARLPECVTTAMNGFAISGARRVNTCNGRNVNDRTMRMDFPLLLGLIFLLLRVPFALNCTRRLCVEATGHSAA